MSLYKRTHTCGDLTVKEVEKKVRLSGWVHRRRDHGGLIFIDLRDRYGLTQLVFDPKRSASSHAKAEKLRSEFVISVAGKVRLRGEGLTNPKLKTGEIEVEVEDLHILSQSETPPFSISDETTRASEEIRLKYRFLDLRRGKILENLTLRHHAMQAARNFLHKEGFLEITTPILAKTTPEGARDYLVPSRIYPGNFYALPQSPQIFKQILMISGIDRYFQIASCFRDEDLRADRQPEFTQLDLEMSFTSQEELFPLMEKLVADIFKVSLGVEIKLPFKRISHQEVIASYGTDKPDLRFGMPLIRIDEIIKRSDFSILKEVLKSGGECKALCFKKGAELSRKEIDELIAFVSPFGLKGLAWMKHSSEGLTSNITKFFSATLLKELEEKLDCKEGDLILIAAEKASIVNQSLDHLRRHIAKKWDLIPKQSYEFLWVTDFPLFKWDEKEQRIESEAHPFTSPHPDDIPLLDKEPLKVRSLAYDLVVNGYELASGSQRIFEGELQKKIFALLKFSEEAIKNKFGFFIDALKYGTPPHLGIAFGFERLTMILADTNNIREVIAFPKTQNASDLMMQSPSEADAELLRDLSLQIKQIKTP